MSTATAHRDAGRAQRTTVRVDGDTREVLRALSRQLHLPMQDVLAQAVESYRRQVMVEEANAAYAVLRANPEAQHALDEERALFESALLDGLQDDPYAL